MHNIVVFLFPTLLDAQLQSTDQIQATPFLRLSILDNHELLIGPKRAAVREVLRVTAIAIAKQHLVFELGRRDK